jgi:hypothetical protein
VAVGGTSRWRGSGEHGDERRGAELEGEGGRKLPLPTRKLAGTTARPEGLSSGRWTVAASKLRWRLARVIAQHAGEEGGVCGRAEVLGVRGRREKGAR